jgi:threonine/homoserine/homoserine lactone efflux protein
VARRTLLAGPPLTRRSLRGVASAAVTELLAFLGVAVLVIVTPGQDTALTIRNTLAGGRRAGVRTAAGVVCGQAVWALAASAGVAALLVASEPAFVALKLAGAAYLVYLGGRALLSAARPHAGAGHGVPATIDAVTGTALVALGLRLGAAER